VEDELFETKSDESLTLAEILKGKGKNAEPSGRSPSPGGEAAASHPKGQRITVRKWKAPAVSDGDQLAPR